MICIAIANSKGGVGKTTLTAALGVRAAKDDRRVALCDLDPQRSLAEWFHVRGRDRNNPSMLADPAYRRGDVADAREKLEQAGYDLAFLDGPPGHLERVREMVAASDFCVIPVKPSSLDLLATVEAAEIARQEGKPHLAVLNDCEGKLARDARGALVSCNIPVAITEISHRVAHVTAMGHGKTASEIGKSGSAAAAEVDALWSEIRTATGKARRPRENRA